MADAGRGQRVNNVGDHCTAGNVKSQFAQLALRGSDGRVMDTFNDAGRRHIKLLKFGVENRLLTSHIAAARRGYFFDRLEMREQLLAALVCKRLSGAGRGVVCSAGSAAVSRTRSMACFNRS